MVSTKHLTSKVWDTTVCPDETCCRTTSTGAIAKVICVSWSRSNCGVIDYETIYITCINDLALIVLYICKYLREIALAKRFSSNFLI